MATPTQIPIAFSRSESCSRERVLDWKSTFFVTARFRSGSTLLWRLLRDCKELRAYYEPLNERRWFDKDHRGRRVDPSHSGVTSYWLEYESLPIQEISWDDDWPSLDLYMPPVQPGHRLHRYLQLLIADAPNRAALQFNRVDFRLEWLSKRFPSIPILHLIRNPRDQWLSTFQKHHPVRKQAVVADLLGRDEFYLTKWAHDLARYIPLLAETEDLHPYELSYLIWRLSQSFADKFSDYQMSYEDLVSNPTRTLADAGKRFHLADLHRSSAVESITATSVNRWRDYASEGWFREREERCDELLDEFVFLPTKQSS